MIKTIARLLIKQFVKKHVFNKKIGKTQDAFSFVGVWRVLSVDFESGMTESLRKLLTVDKPNLKLDAETNLKQSLPRMKVEILADGHYLVNLDHFLVEGTWQQNSPTELAMTDQDNGSVFLIQALKIEPNVIHVRFVGKAVDPYLLQLQKMS